MDMKISKKLLVLFFVFFIGLFFASCSKNQKLIDGENEKLIDKGFLIPQGDETKPTITNIPLLNTDEEKVQVNHAEIPQDLSSRAGFGLARLSNPDIWGERLGAGWYLDWSVRDIGDEYDLEHWQMVRLKHENNTYIISPEREKIIQIAQNNLGKVWIIGNEPDVIWQDAIPAEIYAQAYHELYYLIKQADPSAKLAPAGVSQVTNMRLDYLDRVLAEYKVLFSENLPVDWWTVHGFVLREEKNSWGVDIPPGFDNDYGTLYDISDHGSLDLFCQQLIKFRTWMAKNGYQEKPLALTEFGILMPPELGYSQEFIAEYLQDTFYWLATAADLNIGYPLDEYRLIQRWAWFSLSDTIYPASDLVNLELDELTAVGKTYREFLQTQTK